MSRFERIAMWFSIMVALLSIAVLVHGCATGRTLPPMPPLPGPDISEWNMHAHDGGGQ